MVFAFLASFCAPSLGQQWIVVKDTSWSGVGDTGPLGAGSVLHDGWTEMSGSCWRVTSGVLIGTSLTNSHLNNRLLRPTAENQRDARVVLETNTTSPYTNFRYCVLRAQADGSAYIAFWNSTSLGIARISAAGAFTEIGSNVAITTSPSNAVKLDFSVQGASPTSLSATLYDVTAGNTVLGTKTGSDSTGPQVAGRAGVQVKGIVSTTYTFVRTTTYVLSTFSCSPAAVNLNSAGTSVSLTNSVANWTAGTPGSPTFTISGVAGVSITSQSVSNATTATITVATGATEGVAVITDPSTNATVNLIIGNFVAVTDTNVFLSPYNWRSDGTGSMLSNNVRSGSTWAQTACGGAYIKTKFTGTSLKGVFGVTGWTAASNAWPRFRYSIDGGNPTTYQLTSSDNIYTFASGLASATHTFELHVYDTYTNGANRMTPDVAVQLQGLLLSAGATTAAPTLRSGRMLIYGDSIGEGAFVRPGSAAMDAQNSYHAHLAIALNCEYGNISFSGRGWAKGTPTLYKTTFPDDPEQTAWKYHDTSGALRTVSGLLSPSPTYVVITLGTNDMRLGTDPTATVTAFLPVLRTAAPSAWIVPLAPFGDWSATEIAAGVSAYKSSTPSDGKILFIRPGTSVATNPLYTALSAGSGTWLYSSDGLHPDAMGSAIMGSVAAKMIQARIQAFSPTGGAARRR